MSRVNASKVKVVVKSRLSFLLALVLIPEYARDYLRYLKHSGMFSWAKGRNQLIGRIIQDYHVLEKGLTMPESRLGFGADRLMALVDACLTYMDRYGTDDEQLQHAVSVIYEYRDRHVDQAYALAAPVGNKIATLEERMPEAVPTRQLDTSAEDYFRETQAPFPQFSNSRRSIRNYSPQDVPAEEIEKAIDLARNAPSSCNKQGSRVHLYTDRDQISAILEIQTGNRGFGHQVNKLIVVTGEIGMSYNVYERNQVFVDGGMFGMNVLYALHHRKVAACPLNCYLSHAKEKRLRKVCHVPASEALVMMIGCGYPPPFFSVALSPRYGLDTILDIQ